ncbi:MAG: Stp1/IreP family PP2C-type Ser/Thr phosphatase [Clostridia bacterium]|nr:Stp1/IreP family PP2C-type Ser/Thr phosphatase [Clostridia bacterium]
MIYAYRSEKGVRDHNEDSIFVPTKHEMSLAIVADGMGGHNAGNVASSLAVKTAAAELKRGGRGLPEILVHKAISKANTAVYELALKDSNLSGMGTTMVLALPFRSRYIAANVGDSRIYQIYSSGGMRQVTTDHSYVAELVALGYITPEQAKTHPKRNLITRALGTSQNEKIDITNETWDKDDVLVLCTDGLCGTLDDKVIELTVREAATLDIAASMLVEKALKAGSTDNISVVLVQNTEVLL